MALVGILVAATAGTAQADPIACDESGCRLDRARAEQCVTDARAAVRLAAESALRLTDLRTLEREHVALALTLDRTAAALAREQARWPGWVHATLGLGAGVVLGVVGLVLALVLG